ncbi:cytochrome P450 [Wolfiporia cocos MD-104 SS10]|uniref:Cytochrome P450 n=1 Tax=Wolfiporia cocos (strain MD-104) TaxID=742152 RepID=A0A2H3K2E3_WOLCO|nr:cytochrome P450 [Wolfiporia cocos MD-104 SS10]
MPIWFTFEAALCCTLLSITAALYRFREIRRVQLPPGPQPLPILGNVHQVPADYQERTFTQWSKTYGQIIYARFFRTPVLILGSLNIARDFLDKRSNKYSGRPRCVMLREMIGWDPDIVFLDYGDQWRKQRKWMQGSLQNKDHLAAWRSVERRETFVLLSCLVTSPDDFVRHIRRYTAAVLMDIIYGHTVLSEDDKLVLTIEEAMKGSVESGAAGATLVDFFPFLKHVPTWMPGAGFKRNALAVRSKVQQAINETFDMAQENIMAGISRSSIVSTLLEESSRKGTLVEDIPDIKGAAGGVYGGECPHDTTAVLTTFFLAMTLHPEVLEKAQKEIDEVVGMDCLPDFSDRPRLPYVDCVLKELYRWNVPAPLGIPHCVTEDDEYLGYQIRKGTTVVPNIWYRIQNTELYADPQEFRPERFLSMSESDMELSDPSNYIFGFGRRICPGRQFADASIWLALSNLIATMNVSKARDSAGNEIAPTPAFITGITSQPKLFVCCIKPRAERAKDLIAHGAAAFA